MSRRGLAVLAIVLLAVVVLYLVARNRGDDPAEEQEPRLFEIAAERVTGLAVDAPEGAWRVERRGDGWVLVAPFPAEASAAGVESVLSDILAIRAGRVVEHDTAEPVRFGLRPPRASVRLDLDDDDIAHRIDIGSLAPTGGWRYASRDGATVFLIDGSILESATRGPERLRERRLIPIAPEEIRSIRIVPGRAKAFRIVRDGTGWAMTEPVEDRVDARAAEGLARALAGLSIEQFGAATGPWERATRVEVEGRERSWTVRIGTAAGAAGVPARREDADIEGFVPPSSVEPFTVAAWDVRDRRLAYVDVPDIVDVRWTWTGGSVRTLLEEPGGGWRVVRTGDKDRSIEGERIAIILARVATARAVGEADVGDIAGRDPDRTVILRTASGADGSLALFTPNGGDTSRLWIAVSSWRPGMAFLVEREAVPLPDGEAALSSAGADS